MSNRIAFGLALAIGTGLLLLLLGASGAGAEPEGALAQAPVVRDEFTHQGRPVNGARVGTLGLYAAESEGGAPIGSSFPISPDGSVDARWPAVAYNSQRQEYLTVWWNDRPLYDDIYGRRLTTDGELLPWFAIVWGPHTRSQPAVAYNSQDDEYMVVYAEDWNIGGARLPATGGAASHQFGFTTSGMSSTVYYDDPAIAYNPTQNVYLLTTQFVNENWYGARGSKVDGVGILSDGSGMSSGIFTLDGFSTAAQPGLPEVAYNAALDEFLIVWQRFDGSDYNIYGQRVEYDASSSSMQVIDGPFIIFGTSSAETGPAVAAIPSGSEGEYMVVCSSFSGGLSRIVGQRLNGQGNLIGSEIEIAEPHGMPLGQAEVAASTSGSQYLVAWKHGNAVVRVRALSADGEPLGEPVWMGETYAGRPSVVGGPLSDFFVAFTNWPNAMCEIYGHLWGHRVYLPLVLAEG